MTTIDKTHHYTQRFPAEARFVAPAREAVTSLARRAGLDEHTLADLAVAVSEAITNGVLHAFHGRGPGSVDVHAEADRGVVFVTVTDDGVGMRPRDDSPGLGLGLSIIQRMCAGVDVGPGPDNVGTTVRMRFVAAQP